MTSKSLAGIVIGEGPFLPFSLEDNDTISILWALALFLCCGASMGKAEV